MSDSHEAFSLGGDQRDNGDARVRALFQDWLNACRAADRHVDDADRTAYDAALARMDEIERHISATPGGGAALAIKTYLWHREDSSKWVPDYATARFPELFDGECERWDEDLVVSMLRDAAKQVPELAELAAPTIHEDAPLIDADIEIQWC